MPYFLAVYDVRARRVARVMHLMRRYLHHVQNSVFEGPLTEGQKDALIEQARKLLHPDEDALILYEIRHRGLLTRHVLGAEARPFSRIL
ncbi:CRISPR-associated endonuclease Cas2 [Rhodocaloribacter sp.]